MGKFIDFDQVRAQYPILDVAKRLLGADLKPESETKWRGPCPFCSDPRSFRITTDAGSHGQGMAGCFKCGPKGDAIALVAKKFGLKANDAAQYIIENWNTVPRGNVPVPPGNVSSDKLEKVLARLVYEHEEVQALGLTPEKAKALGIGHIKTGILAGRVLFPLYQDGKLVGFMGYDPSADPALKFPPDIVPSDNVVRLKAV